MTPWSEFASEAPELAAAIEQRMLQSRYTMLGTIRSDGWPRMSGIVTGISLGELWLAMRPDATMAADLRRNEKFSLHSGPMQHGELVSDTKLSGIANEVTNDDVFDQFVAALPHDLPASGLALFAVQLRDASLIRLNEAGDKHVIDSWRSGEPGTTRRFR
jgi:hypothetical protein